MRIDLTANVGQAADAGPARKAGSPALGTAGKAAPGADSAQLSTDTVRIEGLSAAVLQLPEVRQEKVAALAEQVQRGNYAVSAEQTAGALLTALTTNRAA
ncbi:MAG: flagellar biosynthesis anti-sigma factor FlgM [Terriglobales bacterium]